MRKNRYILRTISLGLLLGLMVPGLGGLIFPSMLINTVGPFITSQNEKIVLETEDYSYKPGQSGTQYNFYLLSASGEKKDITMKLVFTSFAVYSVFFLILFFLIFFLYRKIKYKNE
jgi:hypothetical protein